MRSSLPRLLLLLPVLACATAPEEAQPTTSVAWLVDHGEYDEAVRVAAAAVSASPGSVEAVEAHRRASVAWYLERGRRLTLAGRDEEALAAFAQAEELEPADTTVQAWIAKTREKIATHWLDLGLEQLAEGHLDEAETAFASALEYAPDSEEALIGAAGVDLRQAYRVQLGEDYYDEGVRAVSEWEYEIARSRFVASSKYRPGDRRPTRRVTEVERELSLQRSSMALGLEEEGFHAAAKNVFRVALLLNPENEAAEAGLARTRVEADADELLLRGKMSLLRGEFAQAREHFEAGLATQTVRPELFEEALLTIDDARAARLYQKALDLEHDFRYEAAIAKFQELLEGRDYYEDALTRLRTLEEYVADAAQLYEQAAQQENPAERAALLRQIELFWPEYRDIREQLLELTEG